jgi:indolepyruvate ferredoxin oxidoreductase
VVDGHDTITGEFTRDTDFVIPNGSLRLALETRLKDRLALFDAKELARVLMGDSIYSNMMVLGAAWQRGLVPITRDALIEGIRLNGQAVDANRRAFELGRWAMLHPGQAESHINKAVEPKSLAEKVAFRAEHLADYQGERLAQRYRARVAASPEPIREAVAEGFHKVLAYKDEYEIARLLGETRAKAEVMFDGDLRLTLHLAPPLIGRTGPDDRPRKRRFGQWVMPAMGVLKHFKHLRGTPLDPFGYTAERRLERALIRRYEADLDKIVDGLTPATEEIAREIARLPLRVRGFGPVKAANAEAAEARRAELLRAFRSGRQLARAAQ